MRIQGEVGPLEELQTKYDLVNIKMGRLKNQYMNESDYALRFNIEKQIRQNEHELNKLAHEIELIEEQFFPEKGQELFPQRPQMIPGRSYDALFFYHPDEQEIVQPIAQKLEQDEHLKILLYGIEQEIDDIYLISFVAVIVGKIEPWRDAALSRVLKEFTDKRIPMVNVILANRREDPNFPTYLRANRHVDFRRQDPDPFEELERLLKI